MVANTRDRNIDSSRREDSRVGTVDRCEVIRVHPHVAPLASGDKDFNTVDLQLIDRPYEDDGSLPIIERAEVNTIQHDHGRFQGRPFNYRVGDLVLVYWLSERRGIILGALPTDEQEPVCRSQADSDHQEFVFKLCPWEQPYQDPITKSFTEFPDPKHPECYKWWPKTRDSLWIFDCLEGHNTPSCCGQACNSLDDHQSSTCFKNFSDISPTTIDLPRRFKFLHHCGSFWYYDDDGTIEIASKLNAALKCHQTFYPSGRILLQNDVTGNFVDIKAADEVEIDAATIRLDGDVVITGSCTHGSCSCESEFASLDGKAGGQTLCGGTGVDEELTLKGTADASKGTINVDADLECTGNSQLPSICGSDQEDGILTLCGTSDVSKGQVTIDSDLECSGSLGTTIKSSIKSYCDGLYSSSSNGVTNGDSHDHSGGDGAQIDHGGLSNLSNDDHTIYLNLEGRTGHQAISGVTTFEPPNFDTSVFGDDFSDCIGTHGCFVGWNRSAQYGETNFVNHRGGGLIGGFGFYEYNQVTDDIDMLMHVKGDGDVYVVGDLTADSYVDHTPSYDGDAITELKQVTSIKGKIDHKTLPQFARTIKIDSRTGKETECRNIGNMVSILTKAVQQLTNKLEAAEKKIAELEAKA